MREQLEAFIKNAMKTAMEEGEKAGEKSLTEQAAAFDKELKASMTGEEYAEYTKTLDNEYQNALEVLKQLKL